MELKIHYSDDAPRRCVRGRLGYPPVYPCVVVPRDVRQAREPVLLPDQSAPAGVGAVVELIAASGGGVEPGGVQVPADENGRQVTGDGVEVGAGRPAGAVEGRLPARVPEPDPHQRAGGQERATRGGGTLDLRERPGRGSG